MTTFSFLTLPAIGHVNPCLAVVAQLIEDGHDVIFHGPEDMRERVEGAGARWRDRPRRRRATTSDAPPPGNDEIRRLPYMMAAGADRTVPPLVEEFEECRPGVIVVNELDLTARLAARALRLRAATFRPFHAVPRDATSTASVDDDMQRSAQRGLDAWAARYALPVTSLEEIVRGGEALRLVFLPRRFQANAEAFDHRYVFVGPSLAPPFTQAWPFDRQEHDRPSRVYVSLGTLRNKRPDFYRLCFEAFAGPDWQVVMAIGDRVDPLSLGAVPPNIHVRAVVPQLALLAKVGVFVTHGGLNSVMEAMWTGVPVVVLPEIAEQGLTAARVEDLDMGIALEHAGLTAARLQSAAARVITDTRIQAGVRAMRDDCRAAGGAVRAAQSLIRLACGGGAGPSC